MVALKDGPGFEGGQVAARPWFGVALTPANLALDDSRQVFVFLFFGAVLQQSRTNHGQAKADQRCRQAQSVHLLLQHLGFVLREPAAAVLGWPLGCGPAALGHDIQPDFHIRIRVSGLAAAPIPVKQRVPDTANRSRSVGVQPLMCLSTKRFEIGHVNSSSIERATVGSPLFEQDSALWTSAG